MSIGIGLNNCVSALNSCSYIRIDTNGKKPPNSYGRDIFTFALYPFGNQVFPEGTYATAGADGKPVDDFLLLTREDVEANCNSDGGVRINASAPGGMCAARIIQDGFKINY